MMSFRTIRRGERVAVWNQTGEVRYVDGPRWLLLFGSRIETLRRYSAESHQYLVVRRADGRTEHLRGPVDIWFDPVEHESIEVVDSVPVNAHEALVVYQRHADESVTRRVLHGPAQYVPAPNEWLHQFQWHGADPQDPRQKIPRGLCFTKLRTIPDQMYFDVQDVRTADDALLVVKLMVFFELDDIERMLDQTHDPIADFINALTADVIDFAASRQFERFKEDTNLLNELDQYANLSGRSSRIGYRVSKVVYRGYVASDKLQMMHDDAIEARTSLKLEAETERQAQELADFKMEREAERDRQRRAMVSEQHEHDRELERLQHSANLAYQDDEHQQHVAHERQLQALQVEQQRAENAERLEFLGQMQSLQVDLTRYLVAQYQHPDRLIRLDGIERGQLHLHEEN